MNVLSEITDCFSSKSKNDYEVYTSRYIRDAIPSVFRYLMESDGDPVRVYAVGGNGILFDCLNGIVDFPNAELTCVPYGSGNDFVRAFGYNALPRFRNIKNLIKGKVHYVDIIHSGSNYALQELNIGLIGQTIINKNVVFPYIPVKIMRKNLGLAYSVCALKTMINNESRPQNYTVLADDEDISGKYFNIHVANNGCNGGTLTPSPYAIPNSGYMDIILAKTDSRLKILSAMGDYNKGKFEKYDFFIHKRCKKLVIKSDSILQVEMDGEGFLAQEINLEILPGHIKFFAPEGMEFMDYSRKAFKGKAVNN